MAVEIINDIIMDAQGSIRVHITYEKSLTLKELSETLDLINKSINDFNRDNGVTNNGRLGKKYASEVESVEAGSIIINLLVNVIAPVALSVLANYIYDRVKQIGVNKKTNNKNTKYPVCITANGGEGNEVSIHIYNN